MLTRVVGTYVSSRALAPPSTHPSSSTASTTSATGGGPPVPSRREFRHRLADRRDAIVRSLTTTTRAVSFWVAIAVPFCYLPLVARGLETRGELVVFVVLLSVNLLALTLGHDHRHPGRDADQPRGR
jgi:hypothetical protein